MRPISSRLRRIVSLMTAVLFVMLFALLAWRSRSAEAQYEEKVIPPSCTENGYTLLTSKADGSVVVDRVVPALGHDYGPWQLKEHTALLTRQSRNCATCGDVDVLVTYPTLSIPTLALDGDLAKIGKKSEVPVNAAFSGQCEFSLPAKLKYQGHSSLSYDKKNYTLKLFRDEAREEKYKMTFEHWNPENKYILKANYIDSSQCRNLICADIWADVVASRAELPQRLKELSNYGAVDGFPIALYINAQFQGLYTWNLHKDDDLYGMKDGCDHAVVIANTDTSAEAYFRMEATFREESPWEVEYCGTEDDQWVKDKFNQLVRFVMESDDETFRRELPQYLDVRSAIDYLICVYTLGLTRHGADEQVLICYSREDPWIFTMYDMETGFGLNENGTDSFSPEAYLPVEESGVWDSATGNLLWDRILQLYFPEIQSRYKQLRQAALQPHSIIDRVSAMMDSIGAELYAADHQVYPHPNPQMDHLAQISQYISKRIELLDNILLAQKGE